jgi:acyl-CoA reductase-like NAD-dependent aldehyde dehydrogenase
LKKDFEQLIPGATTDDGRLEVTAPFDGQVIGSVQAADADAVERALATAYGLFRNRDAWLAPFERVQILEKAVAIMADQLEELALEAAREGGKPLIDSRVEAMRAVDSLRGCIERLRTQSGEEIPMGLTAAATGRVAFTHKEPIGAVAAVSAFNHPLNLIVHQVGPAVAVGCPVIVKPAEDTPLSCFRFVEILHEAGLPPEWCQALVVNDLGNATKLVTDARVAFFSFIGSAGVGWMLRSRLAPGTRCALEHGGAAPVIVAADADLEMAIPLMAKGGFYHAGQVCVSVQRVFVHESIARDVAVRLAAVGNQYVVGDPTSERTEVGPLIRPREVDRVETWVAEAVEAGAELVGGGERVTNSCYACTVLYDPPHRAKVSQMEIFGPVICVYPYRNVDDAIVKANDLPLAFQAAVFTRDMDTALRVFRRIDGTAVMVNDHTAFRVDWMPFAGLRQSGLAVGGIPYTMRDMQVDKLMVIRSEEL